MATKPQFVSKLEQHYPDSVIQDGGAIWAIKDEFSKNVKIINGKLEIRKKKLHEALHEIARMYENGDPNIEEHLMTYNVHIQGDIRSDIFRPPEQEDEQEIPYSSSDSANHLLNFKCNYKDLELGPMELVVYDNLSKQLSQKHYKLTLNFIAIPKNTFLDHKLKNEHSVQFSTIFGKRVGEIDERIEFVFSEMQRMLQTRLNIITSLLDEIDRAYKNREYTLNTILKVYETKIGCEMGRESITSITDINTTNWIAFKCNYSEMENKAKHFGELELVVYDYNKQIPSVAKCDRGDKPEQFEWPRRVVIHPLTNEIFIANFKNSRVDVFDHRGEFQRSIGNGKFIQPHGVDVKGNYLYVVEWKRNGNIFKCDLEGKVIKQFHSTINYCGTLRCDPDKDFIYLFGPNHEKIPRFDSNTLRVAEGTLGKKLKFPVEIRFKGPIAYIMDNDSPCLHLFNKDDETILVQHLPISRGPGKNVLNPQSFDVDPYGNIIVSASNLHCIIVFNSLGVRLCQIGKQGYKPGEFNYPHGIAVDTSGRIVSVNEREKAQLQIF